MTIFIGGCWHFQHRNILKLCNRPFNSVEEMHEDLFKSLKILKKEDELIYLGDMWGYSRADIELVRSKIPCEKITFLWGNHDIYAREMSHLWHWCGDYIELNHNNKKICLFHYPIQDWNGKFKNSIMIHSHSHGNNNKNNIGVRRLDVGYDSIQKWIITLDKAISLAEENFQAGAKNG